MPSWLDWRWLTASSQPAPPSSATIRRNVFVAHGRDEQTRRSVFEFIRSLDLLPLEWETMVSDCGTTAPYLRDVVRHGLRQAQATIVLLTPDDEVRLHPDLYKREETSAEKVLGMQPRPNVLIELGMALALHPDRTIVVEIGNMRPIADTGGLNTVRLDGSDESLGKLVERLKAAGCPVDDSGADWRNQSRFTSLSSHRRKPGNRRKRPA